MYLLILFVIKKYIKLSPAKPMIVRDIPVNQSNVFPTGKKRYPKF